jgi:hypothetical protein
MGTAKGKPQTFLPGACHPNNKKKATKKVGKKKVAKKKATKK